MPRLPRFWARLLAWAFFVVNLLAVTWPGLTFFNRIEPLVLGLPFVMAWLAGWLVALPVVLLVLERAENDPDS